MGGISDTPILKALALGTDWSRVVVIGPDPAFVVPPVKVNSVVLIAWAELEKLKVTVLLNCVPTTDEEMFTVVPLRDAVKKVDNPVVLFILFTI